jgi:excisionase family DNA binding protein
LDVFVNLKTAARALGIHYQTAYKLVRSGKLAAVRIGGGYEISEAAITRYLAERAATRRLPQPAPAAKAAGIDDAIAAIEDIVNSPWVTGDPLLDVVAGALAEHLGDLVVVSSADAEQAHLVFRKVRHRDMRRQAIAASVLLQRAIPVAKLRAGAVLRDGTAVLIPHVPQDVLREHLPAAALQHLDAGGVHSLIAAPIRTNGEISGALIVSRDAPGDPYTAADLEVVERCAQLATTALNRAHLAAEAARRRDQLMHQVARGIPLEPGREHSTLAEIVCDGNARVIAVNDAAVELACTSRENLIGQELAALVSAQERDDQDDIVQRLLIGELPYVDVVRHTACVNAAVPVAVHHGVVREKAARPRALVVVAYELV